MPYRDPDPTDPSVLVGVELPADAEATREMAWVVAEEFARLGFGARRILGLFRSPFYAGAHAAWRALGEAEIAAIVEECVGVWGPHARAATGEGD
ncbi:MAG: hypothetical protein HYS77_01000 [Candidatus Rokubacteria bacterium]|nr:hypothetical protein [Candidatus Rokubacteria bacterium]